MTNARFIFFDVGNTLLFPNRAQILLPLRDLGVEPTHEQWLAVERRVKPEFDLAAHENPRIDHSFWRIFYSHLLQSLGLAGRDDLSNALVRNTQQSANWDQVLPGTREALHRIKKDHRIAVISNADGKIHEVLGRRGIADCFETITDSGVVGYEKPHPAIFKAALESMHAPAAESLYVGDVRALDYDGARSAGMQAVLLDVSGAYRNQDAPRVESLQELEIWLKH